MTLGSARVVTSPSALPSAISRKRRRMIFPERVLGTSAVKMILEGRARAPIFWETCSLFLEKCLYDGEERRHKCLTFRKGEIELPNGMKLLYPDLRKVKDDKGRSQYVYGPDATKLYAGKITNNVTQALARIVMTDGMLRVQKKYSVVGTVHDELICVVPDEEAKEAISWVLAQMTAEPSYMRGIPLDAEGGANRRYGEAKK